MRSLIIRFLLAVTATSTSIWATPQTIRGLGTTSFATSTASPEAQTAFTRGLLLLHLFEYSDAARSFVAAQKLDPAFSLAYWGEAMTSNHGVWNQLDAAAGKAALEKFAPTAAARAAKISDPREKAYMAAVELLYDGTGTKAERDKRYSNAMESLSARFPDDRNARLFYALALLSQSEGVRDIPVYLRAAELAKAVFRREPDNPGAAHYWIHGMDDPDHAAGALEAARALSKIAPDAAHAQHMCSHIFMALGMWDDVVNANVEAIRVDDLSDRAEGFPPYRCGHYPEWLEYGYFQQGRIREARQMVADCEATDTASAAWVVTHPGLTPYGAKDAARLHRRLLGSLADMRNMEIVESGIRTDTSSVPCDTSALMPNAGAWCDFTNGFAAAETGDLAKARSALADMRTKVEAFRSAHDVDPQDVKALVVGTEELSGLLECKSGRYEAGIGQVRLAAETYRDMAFAFGPPVTIKPPEELLGELLMEKGDAAAARKSFEQSLRRAPGRAQSLLGLARAEQLAGDAAASRKTYQNLLAIWHAADTNAPGVEEARHASSGATRASLSVPPTFNRDVAPILYQHCATCHHAGEVAPFALMSYLDAAKRAPIIASVTANRFMPPWKPAPGYNEFQHDNHLSDAEIAVLQAWARAGAPEGAANDRPQPPRFAGEWKLGPPDLVVKMQRPFAIPADGPDVYQCFVLPLGLDQGAQVSVADVRPGDRQVVHHAILYLDDTGKARELAGKDPAAGYRCFGGAGMTPSGSLGGWAPGATPRPLPAGTARQVLPHSDLVLQLHYHPTGKPEEDQTEVGIYFSKEPASKSMMSLMLLHHRLNIPAGEANYRVKSEFVLPIAMEAIGVTPHMHLLGKEMKVVATLPDGETKPVIWIKDWDFNWQGQYLFKNTLDLPAGTKLEMEAVFDNSTANPRNPSAPPRDVKWGENTTDEMAIAFIQYQTSNPGDRKTLNASLYQQMRQAVIDANASKREAQ